MRISQLRTAAFSTSRAIYVASRSSQRYRVSFTRSLGLGCALPKQSAASVHQFFPALPRASARMTATQSKTQTLSAILAVVAALLLVCAVIYVEVRTLGGTVREPGLVETAQAMLIFLSSLSFFFGANRYPTQRGYLILMAALFFCMFIRENDAYLDRIAHGFWAVPAFLVAVTAAILVTRNRATLMSAFWGHAQNGSFWILIIGLAQLVFFSRLFGSGLLWDHVAMEAGSDVAKRVTQEGTELSSYALIFLGSVMSFQARFGSPSMNGADSRNPPSQ